MRINPKLIASDNYSTTETKIGTWIDGKPLYRNYVDLGVLPNTARKNVNTGFPTGITLRKMEAYCYNETTGASQTLPIVDRNTATSQVNIIFYVNQVSILTNIDYSAWKGYAFVYYTKTTD